MKGQTAAETLTKIQDRFPGALRRVRLKRGFIQPDVADLFGVTDAEVSRWESGKRMPRAGMLVAVLEWIGDDEL